MEFVACARRLLVLAVALLTVTTLAVVAGSPAEAAGRSPVRPVDAGVLVIGDSITYRVHKFVIRGRDRPARWFVDAFPGRRVTALTTAYGTIPRYPATTADEYWQGVRHIAFPRPRHRISTAVVALGTNGADTVLDVNQVARMYASQIRRLRGRNMWNRGPRNIVLVTPWRNPEFAEGAVSPKTGTPYLPYTWADKIRVYHRAIHQVARRSRNVRVADWYDWASTRPSRFPDGVHPDNAALKAWRNLVFDAIGTRRR